MIRQFLKTVFLSEQLKHGLLAVCECASFAENVVDVGICTQSLVLLLFPGSASVAFVVLLSLLFQHRATFWEG